MGPDISFDKPLRDSMEHVGKMATIPYNLSSRQIIGYKFQRQRIIIFVPDIRCLYQNYTIFVNCCKIMYIHHKKEDN